MEFLRCQRTIALAVAALTMRSAAVAAPAAPANEYALKSVFLYNFCHFIEWPESAFSSPNEPLIIGIIGDDPFGSLLKEAIQDESYHNRPITIEHYRTPRDIKHCHLLFVSRSESARLDAIISAIHSQSIATVGETDDFLDRGGMIALPTDRNRVHLKVNPAALRAANLSVSSKLLRVADVGR
jgi:hypothetical protein